MLRLSPSSVCQSVSTSRFVCSTASAYVGRRMRTRSAVHLSPSFVLFLLSFVIPSPSRGTAKAEQKKKAAGDAEEGSVHSCMRNLLSLSHNTHRLTALNVPTDSFKLPAAFNSNPFILLLTCLGFLPEELNQSTSSLSASRIRPAIRHATRLRTDRVLLQSDRNELCNRAVLLVRSPCRLLFHEPSLHPLIFSP